MPIDREQPPTNKILLECGPEGTALRESGWPGDWIDIPVDRDEANGDWFLCISPFGAECHEKVRRVILSSQLPDECWSCGESIDGRACLTIGNVDTLGEVISLYETLSQKKWPGCD